MFVSEGEFSDHNLSFRRKKAVTLGVKKLNSVLPFGDLSKIKKLSPYIGRNDTIPVNLSTDMRYRAVIQLHIIDS